MKPLRGQIRKPAGVLVRQLGSESVLLNLDSESYFGLDEVGTRMWAALEQSASLQEAYEALVDEYDVDPKRLCADLAAFVEGLAQAGLVEVVDA
ncbi:MAG: PqqD family protein [Candidatus Eisenbacteria bacterium]